MAYDSLLIYNTGISLLVDVALEGKRTALFAPFLRKYSRGVEAAGRFPYADYPTDTDPLDLCFSAALELAEKHNLYYMEGLLFCEVTSIRGQPTIISIAHGWCRDRRGAIIDPTMHNYQMLPSFLYFGVAIKKEYARHWRNTAGYFGCLDGYKDGRPEGIHYDPPSLWYDEPPRLLDRLGITE